MTKEAQIETIKARLADCLTNKEKFVTLGMFVSDKNYDVENIKIAQKESGINNISDLLAVK